MHKKDVPFFVLKWHIGYNKVDITSVIKRGEEAFGLRFDKAILKKRQEGTGSQAEWWMNTIASIIKLLMPKHQEVLKHKTNLWI